MSRDPERIEPIIACLHGIWAQVPDWRFGQLLSNLLHAMYLENNELDPFFMDDDRFLELVNKICHKWGLNEVRASAVPEWKERCRDCAYLVEGEWHGEWICEHYNALCKYVKECVNV